MNYLNYQNHAFEPENEIELKPIHKGNNKESFMNSSLVQDHKSYQGSLEPRYTIEQSEKAFDKNFQKTENFFIQNDDIEVKPNGEIGLKEQDQLRLSLRPSTVNFVDTKNKKREPDVIFSKTEDFSKLKKNLKPNGINMMQTQPKLSYMSSERFEDIEEITSDIESGEIMDKKPTTKNKINYLSQPKKEVKIEESKNEALQKIDQQTEEEKQKHLGNTQRAFKKIYEPYLPKDEVENS